MHFTFHLGRQFRGLRALFKWANVRPAPSSRNRTTRAVDAAIARDGLRGGVKTYSIPRAPVRRLSAFLEGLERQGEAGDPVYLITGKSRFVHLGSTTSSAAAQRHHAAGRPPPGFMLVERDGQPLCLIGGRGYYNQTRPMDESVSPKAPRAKRPSRRSPSSICTLRKPRSRWGLLHTGLNLDPGESPVDPAVSSCTRHGLLGACKQYPLRSTPTLFFFGRPASRVLRLHPGRDIKGDGRARRVLATMLRKAKTSWSSSPRQASCGSGCT